MIKRLSTEEEMKLVVKAIIASIEADSKSESFAFDYTDDEILDDYLELKENSICTTVETESYRLVSILTVQENEGVYEHNVETFVIFGEDRVYKLDGDAQFILKDITEEEFIEEYKQIKILRELKCNLNLHRHMLLNNKSTIKSEVLINAYFNAHREYNEYLNSLEPYKHI